MTVYGSQEAFDAIDKIEEEMKKGNTKEKPVSQDAICTEHGRKGCAHEFKLLR